MNGESSFKQEMHEVVQEIIRQLLVNNEKPFNYAFQGKLNTMPLDQLSLLNILNERGVIKLQQITKPAPREWDNENVRALYGDKFQITTTKEKLDNYADSLNVQITKKQIQKITKQFTCNLRLDDLDLKLKIGSYPEQLIGHLHEDRPLHKIMIALSNRPPGTNVTQTEVLPNSNSNLWQLFTKSNYAYLSPFFKHSKDRISFQPNIELSKTEVVSIVSKITEKYRKNFTELEKSLQS